MPLLLRVAKEDLQLGRGYGGMSVPPELAPE